MPEELNRLPKVLKDAAKDPDQRMRIKDTAKDPDQRMRIKDTAKDPDQRMRIKDTAARPSDLSTGDIEKRSGASAPLRTTYGEIHLRMSDFRLRKT